MKRYLCTFMVLLCLCCFLPVFAQETEDEQQDYTQQYQEILQSSGAGELMEQAPDRTCLLYTSQTWLVMTACVMDSVPQISPLIVKCLKKLVLREWVTK